MKAVSHKIQKNIYSEDCQIKIPVWTTAETVKMFLIFSEMTTSWKTCNPAYTRLPTPPLVFPSKLWTIEFIFKKFIDVSVH